MSMKTPASQGRTGSPGRHRRRGLRGRLYGGRTVSLHMRRVLGAAAVIGGVTALCIVAALGSTRSGGGIPDYQKPQNPFLQTPASQPSGEAGAGGNRRYPSPSPSPVPSLGLGPGDLVLPTRTTPVPSARSTSPPATTTSPSTSPSPSPPPSPSPEPSPSPSPEPSPSPSPSPPPDSSPPASSSAPPESLTPPPSSAPALLAADVSPGASAGAAPG